VETRRIPPHASWRAFWDENALGVAALVGAVMRTRPWAVPSQSRARLAAPSMDARSTRRVRARQPFRPSACPAARGLSSPARTLGTVSARDNGRPLTGPSPFRCQFVRTTTTSRRDGFGHLGIPSPPASTIWGSRRRFRGTSWDVLAVSTPMRRVYVWFRGVGGA